MLQGALPDRGREFLVTLPVTLSSNATFTALPGSGDIRVIPAHKAKSRRLAEELLRLFDLDAGGMLHVRSELPEGKGCASSSADMVATALAIRSALGLRISRRSLARIMSSIEPSDGVMYGGIVSFYHREGVLRRFLGRLPPLTIVALDEGGQVDTVELNRQPKPSSRTRRAEYEGLLSEMELAVARGDLRSLGKVSTRSAVMNQEVLPKSHLDLLLDLLGRYEALGVVATHSGTQLGLLLDPGSPGYLRDSLAITAELTRHSSSVNIYHTHDFQKSEALPPAGDRAFGHRRIVKKVGLTLDGPYNTVPR